MRQLFRRLAAALPRTKAPPAPVVQAVLPVMVPVPVAEAIEVAINAADFGLRADRAEYLLRLRIDSLDTVKNLNFYGDDLALVAAVRRIRLLAKLIDEHAPEVLKDRILQHVQKGKSDV